MLGYNKKRCECTRVTPSVTSHPPCHSRPHIRSCSPDCHINRPVCSQSLEYRRCSISAPPCRPEWRDWNFCQHRQRAPPLQPAVPDANRRNSCTKEGRARSISPKKSSGEKFSKILPYWSNRDLSGEKVGVKVEKVKDELAKDKFEPQIEGEVTRDFSEALKQTLEEPSEKPLERRLEEPLGEPAEETMDVENSEVLEHEYVHFLLKITEDILRNNIYSDAELETLFKSHIEANKGRLDEARMLAQIETLRKELNLPFADKNFCDCGEDDVQMISVNCKCCPPYPPSPGADDEPCTCNNPHCPKGESCAKKSAEALPEIPEQPVVDEQDEVNVEENDDLETLEPRESDKNLESEPKADILELIKEEDEDEGLRNEPAGQELERKKSLCCENEPCSAEECEELYGFDESEFDDFRDKEPEAKVWEPQQEHSSCLDSEKCRSGDLRSNDKSGKTKDMCSRNSNSPVTQSMHSMVKIVKKSDAEGTESQMIFYNPPDDSEERCFCSIALQKTALKIQVEENNEDYILVDVPVCMPRTMLETKTIPVLIQNVSSIILDASLEGEKQEPSMSRVNLFHPRSNVGAADDDGGQYDNTDSVSALIRHMERGEVDMRPERESKNSNTKGSILKKNEGKNKPIALERKVSESEISETSEARRIAANDRSPSKIKIIESASKGERCNVSSGPCSAVSSAVSSLTGMKEPGPGSSRTESPGITDQKSEEGIEKFGSCKAKECPRKLRRQRYEEMKKLPGFKVTSVKSMGSAGSAVAYGKVPSRPPSSNVAVTSMGSSGSAVVYGKVPSRPPSSDVAMKSASAGSAAAHEKVASRPPSSEVAMKSMGSAASAAAYGSVSSRPPSSEVAMKSMGSAGSAVAPEKVASRPPSADLINYHFLLTDAATSTSSWVYDESAEVEPDKLLEQTADALETAPADLLLDEQYEMDRQKSKESAAASSQERSETLIQQKSEGSVQSPEKSQVSSKSSSIKSQASQPSQEAPEILPPEEAARSRTSVPTSPERSEASLPIKQGSFQESLPSDRSSLVRSRTPSVRSPSASIQSSPPRSQVSIPSERRSLMSDQSPQKRRSGASGISSASKESEISSEIRTSKELSETEQSETKVTTPKPPSDSVSLTESQPSELYTAEVKLLQYTHVPGTLLEPGKQWSTNELTYMPKKVSDSMLEQVSDLESFRRESIGIEPEHEVLNILPDVTTSAASNVVPQPALKQSTLNTTQSSSQRPHEGLKVRYSLTRDMFEQQHLDAISALAKLDPVVPLGDPDRERQSNVAAITEKMREFRKVEDDDNAHRRFQISDPENFEIRRISFIEAEHQEEEEKAKKSRKPGCCGFGQPQKSKKKSAPANDPNLSD